MMKKTYHFVWSDAANQAFEALKQQLAEPPILAAPIDKEPYYYMWPLIAEPSV